MDNYEDMEAVLAAYYGHDAEVRGDLIKAQLVIAAELLNAANVRDTAAFNDALEMADFISSGVMSQFPNKFGGSAP